MKTDRLLEILRFIINNKNVTAGEIADNFDVSIRTIWRDVDKLIESGIPIYADKGHGGGIRIAKSYVLDDKQFNLEEQNLIMANIPNKNNNLISNKLDNLFRNNISNWIEIDFNSSSAYKKEQKLFETLKKAIFQRNLITFNYYGMYSTSEIKEVEPLRFVYRNSTWYLYGFYRVRGNYRFFRIRSMNNIVVSSETFERSVNGSVLPADSMYPDFKTMHIKLKISSEYGYKAFDDFDNCKMLKDGSIEVDTEVVEGESLLELLLSYGNDLRVIEPEELKQEMKNKIEKMARLYAKKGK